MNPRGLKFQDVMKSVLVDPKMVEKKRSKLITELSRQTIVTCDYLGSDIHARKLSIDVFFGNTLINTNTYIESQYTSKIIFFSCLRQFLRRVNDNNPSKVRFIILIRVTTVYITLLEWFLFSYLRRKDSTELCSYSDPLDKLDSIENEKNRNLLKRLKSSIITNQFSQAAKYISQSHFTEFSKLLLETFKSTRLNVQDSF